MKPKLTDPVNVTNIKTNGVCEVNGQDTDPDTENPDNRTKDELIQDSATTE